MPLAMRMREGMETGRARMRRLIGFTAILVGYMLSPLSWWNDAFINIPLSLAIAYALNILTGLNKMLGLYIGYMTTNILGIVLLFYGGYMAAIKDTRTSRSSLLVGTLASLVYTVIASLLLHQLGLL